MQHVYVIRNGHFIKRALHTEPVELLRVAGCELRYEEDLGGPVAVVDRWQRTSVPGILAAGDGTGVRGRGRGDSPASPAGHTDASTST